jgi:hypothetical protein
MKRPSIHRLFNTVFSSNDPDGTVKSTIGLVGSPECT